MARKDMLLKIVDNDPYLYQNERQPCGDTPQWLELSQLGSIAYIDESLSTYNLHEVSATQNTDEKKILETSILMKEQMLYLIDKYKFSVQEKARHTRDLWRRRLKLAFYESNQSTAEEAKKSLGSLSPVEWLQYWGAKDVRLNRLFKPILNITRRDLIPTEK